MLFVLLFLAIYPFVLYPQIVRILAAVKRQHVSAAPIEPSVTIVIAAHNEAATIEATVRNKLGQDYPKDCLSVVVVSDGSEDGTDEIVKNLAHHDACVSVLRQEPRQGKTAALNLAIKEVNSEIVIFSDANSDFAPDAVRQLVKPFADSDVGYVTGRMTYTDLDGTNADDGGAAYMRHENQLRAWETAVGSIVGVDGGIDAIRRELYLPMRPDQLPDFVLPLDVVEQGYRVVYEPRAELREASLTSNSDELRMRVRVSLRALWALWDKRSLMNPLRFPLYSWQLVSHKLLRYLSVYPLFAAALLAVAGAAESKSHLLVSIAYAAAGVAALLGMAEPFRRVRLFRLSYYFATINFASLLASLRFLRRDKIVVWSPRLG